MNPPARRREPAALLPNPTLRVVVLGSGSAGNATAVTDGATTLLLDCGLSAREVATRLSRCGIAPESVSAIVLTHEHSDHVRGVDVFARRHAPGCTVYATTGTLKASSLGGRSLEVARLAPGEALRIGTVTVLPFRISHDAAEPVGFRFESAGESVGIATDTGVLTAEAAEALAGVTTLGIECNHDLGLLDSGPYPGFLKRRIRSERGHLSNEDAAGALRRLAHSGLAAVIALHRSATNNTASLAAAALGDEMARLSLSVPVLISSQHAPCEPPAPAVRG